MACESCRQRALRKAQQKQLPSYLEMAQNLAFSAINAIKYALKTGQVVASQETIEKRVKTCTACNFLIHARRCKLCGCFIVAKTGLAAEKCPQGKW